MRRRKVFILGGVLLVVVGIVGSDRLLASGPEPKLPLTDLKTFLNMSNMNESRVPIGGGQIGFGFTSEYRMTVPWKVAAPRLDAELTRLGFTKVGALGTKSGEWDRTDMHVTARVPAKPEEGSTYILRLTRAGTMGERMRDKYYDLRYSLRRP